MTHYKALSILSGLLPLEDDETANAVLRWAALHPEQITTGQQMRALEQIRCTVEDNETL
jgi:hypothetical protein